MKKLKERWNIHSNTQVIIILLVFSITGSLSLKLSGITLAFLGITKINLSLWFYWPLNILTTFILYQILLVTIGTIFGQHTFFWTMEKKMLSRIGFKRFLKP